MKDPLLCVAPDQVSKLWHIVHPMIEMAYAEVDEFAPPDMLEKLTAGKLLLWVSAPAGEILAVLVTALIMRPSGLACRLMACGGGSMSEWIAGHAQIEAYAKAEGCVKLCAEGRRGWSKLLPGYETRRVVLEKSLA